MAVATVETQVDSDLKLAAEKIFAEAGLSVSDALRMMLNRVVKEQSVSADLFYPNAETIEAMEEARRGGLRSFATIEDLLADLHAEA
jgi:DNA-damage-inducible protein J